MKKKRVKKSWSLCRKTGLPRQPRGKTFFARPMPRKKQ